MLPVELAIFWVLFAVAVGLFGRRLYLLFRLIRLGQREDRFDNKPHRMIYMVFMTLFQWCSLRGVTRKDLAGIGHTLLFTGFLFMLLGYIIFIGFAEGFGLSRFLSGSTFEAVYFSILDFAAILVVTAVIWAAIRRYIVKPERLEGEINIEAGVILILIFVLMVLHFCIEGFGNAAHGAPAFWPIISGAFARFLAGSGIAQGTLVAVYKSVWWLHYLIILGFMVFIAYSKHLHILASFPNIFLKGLAPKGALRPVDLDKAEVLGAAKIQDFTWKQLLDLYACAVCGRCHAICPATLSGKALSPRELILNLKEHLLEVGPTLLSSEAKADNPGKALIGGVVTEDEIWACVTCRACQEVCPVCNEHVDKIIDLRRYLVLEEARLPETAESALRSIEDRGHPWRGTTLTRTDWAEGLDIKALAEDSEVDILYWVGCTEALEERSRKVAQAMAEILKQSGVKFGILGVEESCCGEPARRLGNEYIFQMQAEKNIGLFKQYNVKKIITACPHCFNTIKNEYPQFGGEFEVVHHTEFIADLLEQGKLKLNGGDANIVTYHDSCYLGRYNDIYEAPRKILGGIAGVKLTEMEQNRQDGFCCGGGGGRMWLEEPGTRICNMRVEEAAKTEAQTIATACPFCLQMMEEGIKANEVEEKIKAMDIAELVSAASQTS